MKVFYLCLLLCFAQESAGIKNCPVSAADLTVTNPSISRHSDRDPILKVTLQNLSDKPIRAISYSLKFRDTNREIDADEIKGILGDQTSKKTLLKANERKAIEEKLFDYYVPGGWFTSERYFKVRIIYYTDGTTWLSPDELKRD